jgi:hypothetical protein
MTNTPSAETLAANFKYQLLRRSIPELEAPARKRLSAEIEDVGALDLPDSAKKVVLMFVRSINEHEPLSRTEASLVLGQ